MIRNRGMRAAALAMALALGTTASGLHAQDDEAVFDGAINSTVRVMVPSKGRVGTGWVIASADKTNRAGAAVIVTSYSTIEGLTNIVVREPNSNENRNATVLDTDPDRNLALLEVKDIAAKQIPLTRTPPRVGRSVWATGYNEPADRAEMREAINATIKGGRLGREFRGRISTEARADSNQIEHDAAMVRGFEGGPLLDRCGRVIAVNMKSGGQVVGRAAMRVDQSDAIMNALKADEVIAFAKSKQVEPEVSDGEGCGTVAAAAPAKTTASAPTTAPGGAPFDGDGATSALGGMLASPALLGVLVLAGLGLAIFGVMALRRKTAVAGPTPVPGRPSPMTSSAPDDSTMLLERPRTATVRGGTMRLDGHGPDGSPINLEFSSEALRANPVLLGAGANAEARVADNRSDYKVSRLHARLAFDSASFTIEDNKSLNGTMLNGKMLDPHRPAKIVTGDVISLADIDLRATIA